MTRFNVTTPSLASHICVLEYTQNGDEYKDFRKKTFSPFWIA